MSRPRYSLALSSDGQILALGEPNADRINLYDAEGSSWILRGRSMEGPLGSDFGYSISMSKGLHGTVRNHISADPIRIASAGLLGNQGFVRVYECMHRGCIQLGEDVVLGGLSAHSRTVHALSSDGTLLAFGGHSAESDVSTIRFYSYNETSKQWVIDGTPGFDYEGEVYAMAFSGDFETVAIRSMLIEQDSSIDESEDEAYNRPKFKATDAKAVLHLDEQAKAWVQLGHNILTEVDGIGRTPSPADFHIQHTQHRLSEFIFNSDPIAISEDGNVMAAGFPFVASGVGVTVYAFDRMSREWSTRGGRIENKDANGFKGWSVGLNGMGDVVVVGSGGDETATNTYIWDGGEWHPYGPTLPGGEWHSLSISDDGSVLAIGRETVDVYHRNIKEDCLEGMPGMSRLHLSLTLDNHPEDTRWDLMSQTSKKVVLAGGPYVGSKDVFPYETAYQRSTVVAETCIPNSECVVLSLCKSSALTDANFAIHASMVCLTWFLDSPFHR